MNKHINTLITAGAHAVKLAVECHEEAAKWPTRPKRKAYWEAEAMRHEKRAQFMYDRANEAIELRKQKVEDAA